MRHFPNSSIINIITRDNERGGYDILYICTRAVPDIFEAEEVFWYNGKGKLAKASFVWEKLKIRQWVAHGKDHIIQQLYLHVLIEKNMIIDGQTVNFHFPQFTKQLVSPDPYFDRNQNEVERLITEDFNYFPPELLIAENLKIMCGYKPPTKDINPLFPLGFFDKDYLIKRFTDGVFGEKNDRVPYLTFHGVVNPASKTREVNAMTGFYQENFNETDNFSVKFKDTAGNENGLSTVNKQDGIFYSKVIDTSGRGSISISRNASAIRSTAYTLIKEINFNIDIARGNVTDAYGQQYMLGKNSHVRPSDFEPDTWHKSSYGSVSDGNKALSKKFQEIINYMGPNILIADPYYINNIKNDPVQNIPVLTDCQISLLNAISVCATTTGINELYFLGFNTRANNFFEKDDDMPQTTNEQRFIKYEQLFKEFISSSNLSSYFKAGSINFLNAPKDFHNRYWFSLSEDKTRLEKCIILTNSIGNMTEVDFIEVTNEPQRRQITGKYFNLFKAATNELSI